MAPSPGSMAGCRRKHLTSLCTDGGCGREAMALQVVAGARAHFWRFAMVIAFPGRGCFEMKKRQQCGQTAFALFFPYVYYSASDCQITCCVTQQCFNSMWEVDLGTLLSPEFLPADVLL